eukprot:2363003-Pleurochrysis_carterae.AAC.1
MLGDRGRSSSCPCSHLRMPSSCSFARCAVVRESTAHLPYHVALRGGEDVPAVVQQHGGHGARLGAHAAARARAPAPLVNCACTEKSEQRGVGVAKAAKTRCEVRVVLRGRLTSCFRARGGGRVASCTARVFHAAVLLALVMVRRAVCRIVSGEGRRDVDKGEPGGDGSKREQACQQAKVSLASRR